MGSLAFRPAILLFGNSRPRVATTPLPHATEAYGQLLGRDLNPLDLLLLLRTVRLAFPGKNPSKPRVHEPFHAKVLRMRHQRLSLP